jgi:hypothetical protein
VLGVTACGSDTAAPPQGDPLPAELLATWGADTTCLPHCGFTLSAVANPAQSVNVVAPPYRIEVEIAITAAGGFRLTYRPGTTSHGTVRRSGNLLIVDGGGATDTLEYSIVEPYVHLHFRRTFQTLDFSGDGAPDPATAVAVLRRR